MRYLPSILLLGFSAFCLHAQTSAPGSAATVGADPFVKKAGDTTDPSVNGEVWPDCLITFEAYALAGNDAAAVLQDEQSGAARYRQVLELAASGKARLEILTALTSKSGQRAVCESNDAVRYGSEFAPPATARGIPVPIAWTKRDAGDTLEIEPVRLGDGVSCDINLVPQHVSLAGFRDLPGLTGDAATSQPVFNIQKMTTATQLKEREPHYLGTFSPPTTQDESKDDTAPEVWLAFLHLSQPTTLAAGKPAAKLDPEGLIHLEYSVYSLDRTLARDLVIDPESVGAPWEKLQALLAEHKARLEHITTIKTKGGQRTVNEETQEVRFISGYTPQTRADPEGTVGRAKDFEQKDAPQSGKVATTEGGAGPGRIPGFGGVFETENVGTSVTAEPVFSPLGPRIDINEVVQSVKYVGDLKATGVAAQYPAMPVFETAKITTSQSAPPGVRVLVSTLSPPTADGVNGRADEGRTWLLFVRATIGEP
jgi:hypothetical protein